MFFIEPVIHYFCQPFKYLVYTANEFHWSNTYFSLNVIIYVFTYDREKDTVWILTGPLFYRYLVEDNPTMSENDTIPEGTSIGNFILCCFVLLTYKIFLLIKFFE